MVSGSKMRTMTSHTTAQDAGTVPTWTLGDRLVKARDHAGLDQDQLGERIGLSRQTISNYERGRVEHRPRALRQWARACGVDEDWLLTGTYGGDDPTSADTSRYLHDLVAA